MKDSFIYYSVGALLYCPANNETITSSIIHEQFGKKFSLALCLEDTIKDDCVKDAEQKLITSLNILFNEKQNKDFYMPMIFIRIRDPRQIYRLYKKSGAANKLITGFIIPKFSLDNADLYISEIVKINQAAARPIYMMPIFESPSIINLQYRYHILYTLKEKLDSIEKYVLNIRVGGNDLCHMFGFRRHDTESIHNIRPIANIFSDIITVYGMDYVVSGPVWEYYNGKDWAVGLSNELIEDRECGFIGKTVIHPRQIELVNSAYKVSHTDLADAKAILSWNNSSTLVSGNSTQERMNEYKTHSNWAKTIIFLSEYYGVR